MRITLIVLITFTLTCLGAQGVTLWNCHNKSIRVSRESVSGVKESNLGFEDTLLITFYIKSGEGINIDSDIDLNHAYSESQKSNYTDETAPAFFRSTSFMCLARSGESWYLVKLEDSNLRFRIYPCKLVDVNVFVIGEWGVTGESENVLKLINKARRQLHAL